MEPLAMNAATRGEALQRFRGTSADNPLDLLVVGGGVVGAAAAFDATTRGLSTGLVESRDIAEGTSSRSSKLVHGGLRYLQMLDFKLVAEALRERNLLLARTAPHLVRGLPFVFPFTKRLVDRAFIGAGVTMYDSMSAASAARWPRRPHQAIKMPFHRHLSRKSLKKRFPGLNTQKFVGALEYFDAQVDDARLVLTLARSAHSLGASIATRTKVVDYLRTEATEGSEPAVIGAILEDQLSGERIRVYAKETMICTGVWTDQQEDLAEAAHPLKVLASKGAHITVPKDRITSQGHVGVISQTANSVLFIIPMRTYWVLGTTDTPWSESVDSPAPTAKDIEYILNCANDVLAEELSGRDVIGSWAGLRPLLQPVDSDSSASSSKVSREHSVSRLAPGLSAAAGGKLTTYRSMAEDAVNFATATFAPGSRSKTRELPLLGAEGYPDWVDKSREIQHDYGISEDGVERLLNRYGSLIREVLELIEESAELASPVGQGGEYLRVEYLYAARYEGALSLIDLLERRTRLFFEVADRGVVAAAEVAELVAPELGWDQARIEAECARYTEYVNAHVQAEGSSSDTEAALLVEQSLRGPSLR